jgi:hypothetical protein
MHMRLNAILVLLLAPVWAGSEKKDLTAQEADEVVRKFAAKESEFARARENYTYKQHFRIQELDSAGVPGGKREMKSDIVFTSEGKRTERVTFAPVDTLRNLQITQQDEDDLRSVQPFVLTSREIDEYNIRFLGWEQLDELGTYSFAVKPKKMVEGKRYFAGVIWVDDQDLQIVKTYGRGVGIGKLVKTQKFPKFATFREQIDGKYWFPTYTEANDILPFESGPLPIKMTVTYREYKQFKSESTITYGDVAETPPAKDPKPPTPPVKKQ